MHRGITAALLQQAPRHTHVPFVTVRMKLDKLTIVELGQINLDGLSWSVTDVVNTPVAAVPDFRCRPMASIAIVPVDQVHTAVRTVFKIDATKPVVVGKKDVVAVLANKSRPVRFQDLVVHTVAVDVTDKQRVTILLRPIVAKVNHAAAMGVPATG